MCDKSFKSKNELQCHKKGHSNERPYKCSCIQSFKRLSHLRRHMRTSKHHVELDVNTQIENVLVAKSQNITQSKDLFHTSIENKDSFYDNPQPLNEINDEVNSHNTSKESQTEIDPSSFDPNFPSEDVCAISDACPISEELLTYSMSSELEQAAFLKDASLSENTAGSFFTSTMDQATATVTETEKKTLSQLSSTAKHAAHMKNEGGGAIPQLTSVMEQSYFTLRNNDNVSVPSLQLIEQPALTFSEQGPSENLSVATVVEQSVSFSEGDDQHGCVQPPLLSEVVEQNKVIEQFELCSSEEVPFGNQSRIDATSCCTFYQISPSQSSIINSPGQIFLSIPPVQGASSLAQSLPNFSIQPLDFAVPDDYTLYGNEVSNSISIPCSYVEENAVQPTFISEGNQNVSTKQLMGESNQLVLTLSPPCIDNSLYGSLQQPVNSSAVMLDDNYNQMTICTNGGVCNSIYNTLVTPMQNVVTMLPMNVDNFVFF